jgi:cytochrome o ubiquinol oxidase subunit IV
MVESKEKGKVVTYTIGFILSILLTFLAYFLVVNKSLESSTLTFLVMVFAIVQLIVQLLFFLHLGQEEKPHWNLVMAINTAAIILILVVGSIWIMTHLNYHKVPEEVDVGEYMMEEENIIMDSTTHYP